MRTEHTCTPLDLLLTILFSFPSLLFSSSFLFLTSTYPRYLNMYGQGFGFLQGGFIKVTLNETTVWIMILLLFATKKSSSFFLHLIPPTNFLHLPPSECGCPSVLPYLHGGSVHQCILFFLSSFVSLFSLFSSSSLLSSPSFLTCSLCFLTFPFSLIHLGKKGDGV